MSSTGSGAPRGRYAPSPTGELHLGNGSTALLAWSSVRARGGSFVLRMEDLDRNRSRPAYADRMLEDLTWLGLDWDEGPDRGGPHRPYDQWSRRDRYEAAFSKLRRTGRVYPCFCSRADVAAAANAPQSPGEEPRYPGTCLSLSAAEVRRRIDGGARHAWRFLVDRERSPVFDDLVRGPWGGDRVRPPGDFVVFRSTGEPAYQLAVVVDDAEMGITEVVRGDDLLHSTLRQLLLFEALGFAPPVFGHVPMLLGPDDVRLSKRHQGTTLRELREAGASAEGIVGRLAFLLGLRATPKASKAREILDGFSLKRLRAAPHGIRIDPGGGWGAGSGVAGPAPAGS